MSLNPRTSSKVNSIWIPVAESNFHANIAKLWKSTKGRPKDPAVYELPVPPSVPEDSFPLQVEIQLAKAFAFIAGVRRGVECVSAAVVERSKITAGELTITLASNSRIRAEVEQNLKEIARTMREAAVGSKVLLRRRRSRLTSPEIPRRQCQDAILQIILHLNVLRINDRLRSRKGSRHVLLNGLREILKNIQRPELQIHHPQLIARIEILCTVLNNHAENFKTAKQMLYTEQVVIACHSFCAVIVDQQARNMLRKAGIDLDKARGDPTIQKICKIAAYNFFAETLSAVTSDHKLRGYFFQTNIRCIPAYNTVRNTLAQAVGGGDRSCRVHAEIQLITYLDLKRDSQRLRPRVICSGKAACFLCELFLNQHGLYFVPETHGKLTPHWTIPDLETYDSILREQYRSIICRMNDEICRLASAPHPKRPDPTMSWLGLSQIQLQLQSYPADIIDNLGKTRLSGHTITNDSSHRKAPPGTDAHVLSTPDGVVAPTTSDEQQNHSPVLVTTLSSKCMHLMEDKASHLTVDVTGKHWDTPLPSTPYGKSCPNHLVGQHKPWQVRSSLDLSGQQHSAAKVMRDHGSRTCDSLQTCITEEVQESGDSARSSSITHVSSESRWIDFHEIEFLVEFERSTKALTIAPCQPISTQETEAVVDANDLQVDREITINISMIANGERYLYFAQRKKSGQALWWKMRWRN